MSHMNSARVPAAMIFITLMVVILLGPSRSTYRFGPAPNEHASAAVCPAQPEPSLRADELRRFCPRPRRLRQSWTQEAQALGERASGLTERVGARVGE